MNQSNRTTLNYNSKISQSLVDFKLPKLKDANAIENRLPNTVFTGPNSLRDQRVIVHYDTHDISFGPFSKLRTYNTEYITRGHSGSIIKRRKEIPGEVGWSYDFFKNIYPGSISSRPYFHGLNYPR